MFDITSRSSFEACTELIKNIRENSDNNCKVYLVGNKIDLEDQRKVSSDEAKVFARKMALEYVETSAIQNNGVNEVFQRLINGNNNNFNNIFVIDIHLNKKNDEEEKEREQYHSLNEANFEYTPEQTENKWFCCGGGSNNS